MSGLADRSVGEALAALASPDRPAAAGVASALVRRRCCGPGRAHRRARCRAAGRRGLRAPEPRQRRRLRALAARAAELGERLLLAADDDERTYARVLDAPDSAARAAALSEASEPPLAVAECAAEIAEAANEIAQAGSWPFKADAIVAAELAAAAARGGAELVVVNLADSAADPRIARARAAAERARHLGPSAGGRLAERRPTPTEYPAGTLSSRRQLSEQILAAKRSRGLTWAALAETLDAPVEWATAALLGQFPLDERQARAAADALGLGDDAIAELVAPPMRGALDAPVPTDPTVYRLYEIVQVYGPAIKELIHEEFGDGIMSAINFGFSVRRDADPNGDRVEIVLNGKFLPYEWRRS